MAAKIWDNRRKHDKIVLLECYTELSYMVTTIIMTQARVQGGGAQVACPPPPLEIEKQKKKVTEQILSYFIYILLLF